MATNPQSFIQPMAQAASPFVPNNGNPNTVYNTAATPFGGQPAGWNTISPFGGTNLADLWSFAPASTSVPTSAFADESRRFWQNMSGVVPAQVNLENSGAVWPDGSNPFMPPQQQPVPGTGIEVPGDVTPDIHPHDPDRRPTPEPPPYTGGGPSTTQPGGPTRPAQGTGGTILPISIGIGADGREHTASSRPTGEITSGLTNLAEDISRGMGFTGRDGKFDPAQFLDAVTEIVLPGDFYNANIGRANWPNIVQGALNAVVPGLGRLARWLANMLPDDNPIREWLDKGDLQDLVDEAYEPDSYMEADQNPFNNPTASSGAPMGGGGGGHDWSRFDAPVYNLNNDPMLDRWGIIGGISAA